MNKSKTFTTEHVIIATLMIAFFIACAIIFKAQSEVNTLTNENLELRQRVVDANDEISALEHELHSARNMIGDWTTFEYNEYLEELCLRFNYTHTIYAINPIEGDSILQKKITIHGDW